jgi:hypothetical protein
MTNLISGKEALIALANGEEVEFQDGIEEWSNAGIHTYAIGLFLNDCYKFRIKPRTITLNGIAVPKPQKNMPEKGDDVFTLDFTNYEGYVSWTCQSSINTFDRDWWKSEYDIKQVVAALRQVFGEI